MCACWCGGLICCSTTHSLLCHRAHTCNAKHFPGWPVAAWACRFLFQELCNVRIHEPSGRESLAGLLRLCAGLGLPRGTLRPLLRALDALPARALAGLGAALARSLAAACLACQALAQRLRLIRRAPRARLPAAISHLLWRTRQA